MTPRTAGVAGATRIALKSSSSSSSNSRLTRHHPLPPFLQTTTSSSLSHLSKTRSTNTHKTKTTITITNKKMANVQVQQQPHHQQQFQYEQHTSTSMSALQAPLPRHPHHPHQQQQNHIPHYSTLRRPIPNSYWATPYLLACEYPWAPSTPRPKLDALLAAGVRTFIDLTESGELIGYSQLLPLRAHSCGLPPSEQNTIEYFRFPIPDRCLPSSPEFLARILSVIGRCERDRRVAAVHCRGGIGRTGTVVGCWLVQSGRCRDGEEALDVIARHWATVEKHTRFPCSPETGAQAEFVRNFKRISDLDKEAAMTSTTTSTVRQASSAVPIGTATIATVTATSVPSATASAASASAPHPASAAGQEKTEKNIRKSDESEKTSFIA